MKRIITKTIPPGKEFVTGAVMYDGFIDVIVADDFDHTGALYAAKDTPVPEVRDTEGTVTKVAEPVTTLVPPGPLVIAKHTFAGWPIVGKPVTKEVADVTELL